MHRTRIKICGICRRQDALLAAELGADAIGIACHSASARYVPPDDARDLIRGLPAFVTPVLLFVDADERTIRKTAEVVGASTVQLHGHESPEDVRALDGLNVLKAVRVDPVHFSSELKRWRDAIAALELHHLRGLILETATSIAPGGTGMENDWETIRAHRREFESLPSMIAAGGLRPGNVTQVIRDIRPFAVDVSSGVEIVRREKDASQLQAFISAVRAADAAG